MRELTVSEMETISGGFCGSFSFGFCGSVSFGCGSSLRGLDQLVSTTIGATAGLVAGIYNVTADLFNGASCSATNSAIQNISSDVAIGAQSGAGMSVSGALSYYNNTISSINNAVSYNNCGFISGMTLIGFPPSTGGGLG